MFQKCPQKPFHCRLSSSTRAIYNDRHRDLYNTKTIFSPVGKVEKHTLLTGPTWTCLST